MQLRRLALVVIVLGSVLPTVHASAYVKPKPLPCKQISDKDGDGTVNPIGLNSPALDVLSADISTGRNEVTATLRLKSTAIENDNYLVGGALWNFNVTAGGTKYTFYAKWSSVVSIAPRALTGGLTAGSNDSVPAATFSRVGNNFVWTVSRAAVPILKKAKQYIYVTSATSGADSLSGDSAFAPTNTKYLDKTPTCLPSK